MKRTLILLTAVGLAATLGCGTTKQMAAEKYAVDKYAADQPIETAPKRPGRGELDESAPAKAVSRIDPDSIDEENANEYLRRLQRDVQSEKTAASKLGR